MYREAHALVAPSWSETFGQCVFEALARSTPVLATQVGAFGDYLQHRREALLVPPRDPDQLAVAAIELMRDVDLRSALRERAPVAAARFDPEVIGRALFETYTGCTS
jgi:glycosyltransferase involved in cell wall biosynthesis